MEKVRFMADKVGDEFEGYITGVTVFGLFIELIEHFVEGLVHISTMADDYYRFVERAHILRGENTGKEYRLGDRVAVQVVKVDMERRQVNWEWSKSGGGGGAEETRTTKEHGGSATATPVEPDGHEAGTRPFKEGKRTTTRARPSKQRPAAANDPIGRQ